jgi:hypothetical protein
VPGKTRCLIGGPGTSEDQVDCQNNDGNSGFPQAPSLVPGLPHANHATVTDSGKFDWYDPGDQHSGDLPNETEKYHVLDYGQIYSAAGWTITPTEHGTTFEHDRTGHGMFISIDNADVNAF